jgi:hypothetical protein
MDQQRLSPEQSGRVCMITPKIILREALLHRIRAVATVLYQRRVSSLYRLGLDVTV